MSNYSYLANADPKAIEALYQQFTQDPSSIDEGWKKFFEGFEFAQEAFPVLPGNEKPSQKSSSAGIVSDKEVNVRNLIHAYR
ncbi:MAG TPA: hypothetical protein VIN11_06670, partial [Roseivirga sp.]